jgi:hypothetical protein
MNAHWPVLAAYLLTLSPLYAQGGFPTNPYCAQYSDGSSLDCSFSTLSQCYQSVSGVGGICINNPRAGLPAPAGNSQYAFSPSPMPPPPIQQPQGPMQLPGPPAQQPQRQSQAALSPPPPPACNPLYDGTYCATASAPAQSLSGDLTGGGEPPATLGGTTFSGNTNCIGILRALSCGG